MSDEIDEEIRKIMQDLPAPNFPPGIPPKVRAVMNEYDAGGGRPKPDVTLTNRQYKFKAGEMVQVIAEGFSGEIGEIKWIEPMGYYPYAVDVGAMSGGVVYFGEDELEEIEV